MKEKTIESESELGKHDESATETPPMQHPEEDTRRESNTGSDPLKKLQDELAEAKDKYVRLYAEFENHRRRTAREKLEMIQGANEVLLKSLLPVVDDFDRAEKSFKDKNDKEAEGFFIIQNKFKKVLDQTGVKSMETKAGDEFNPDLHEAITSVPADDKLKGKIVDVVEKGYVLNDKVIRFAKVVTGS
ncbi:MAG TPA: nucleotide exchange factor GrpE [Cyclobacteriaceae bacterium]|nr:nucleotide exchange factor GrpE [Cyclobacteriaceae bacterium]